MNPDAQEFLDTISAYDCFSGGWMDVEQHCDWLALAFELDGVTPRPSANAIYDLISSLANEVATEHGTPPLQRTTFKIGAAYIERIHPGGNVTLLHPGTAYMMLHTYIYSLGRMVGKPAPQSGAQIGYWIDPGWTFVTTLVDGFNQCLSNLMLQSDQERRQARGYSLLEAMKFSLLRPDLDPEVLLEKHARAIDDLRHRVVSAIDGHAFMEAISLQERLLTALLGQALEVHERCVPGTLAELIGKARDLDASSALGAIPELWDRIHAWRRNRNKAIHGSRTSVFEAPFAMGDIEAQARNTAEVGLLLIAEVQAWCIEARARSLDMTLSRPRGNRPVQ